jgi:hypothetical protein
MEQQLSSPPISRSSRSVFRFWINPYVTVILTAPLALFIVYLGIWYAINAVFANLVLVLTYPLAWAILSPLCVGMIFSPAFVTFSLLHWVPEIWGGRRPAVIRLLLILGALIGVIEVGNLVRMLTWGVIYWIGAGSRADQLVQTAPSWLVDLGVISH